MPRILLSNNSIKGFAGSELVTQDLALEFIRRGYEVTIATFGTDEKYLGKLVDSGVRWLDLGSPSPVAVLGPYDVIWSHHFTTLDAILMDQNIMSRAMVFSSQSPFEPLEAPPHYAAHLSAVLANSEETRRQLLKDGLSEHLLKVFPNPVSPEWYDANRRPSAELTRIAVVSNHVLASLKDAVQIIRASGVTVEIFGLEYDFRLVTPELLSTFDCVITIGRTVQQAMVLGVPVYCHDRFGGPGYLTPDNVDHAAGFNYSGRCVGGERKPAELAQKILGGHAQAVKAAEALRPWARARYRLQNHVDQVVDWVKTRPVDVDALNQSLALARRTRQHIKNQQLHQIFAQLFWDRGSGFAEALSIQTPLLPIYKLHERVHLFFNLADKSDIVNLRFDPINACAAIDIHGVELVFAAGSVDITAEMGSNAKERLGGIYYFVDNDPWLAFPLAQLKGAIGIRVSLTYKAVGREALRLFIAETEKSGIREADLRALGEHIGQLSRQLVDHQVSVLTPVKNELMDRIQEISVFSEKVRKNYEKVGETVNQAFIDREEIYLKQLAQAQRTIDAQLSKIDDKEREAQALQAEMRHQHMAALQERALAQQAQDDAHARASSRTQTENQRLLDELRELEKSVAAQVQKLQQAHEKVVLEQARELVRRHHVHTGQLNQAKHQSDSLLAQIRDKEKKFSDELAQVQVRYERLKAELLAKHAREEKAGRAELALTRQKVEFHLQNLAGRERKFAAQLQAVRQSASQRNRESMLAIAQREESVDRLGHQLGQSELQVLEQQRQRAQQEAESARQLLAMQREFREQLGLRDAAFHQRETGHAEQLAESAQTLRRQLADRAELERRFFDELNLLRQTHRSEFDAQKSLYEGREASLKQDLQGCDNRLQEHLAQASVQAQSHAQQMDALNQELYRIKGSITWRLTGPLRRLVLHLDADVGKPSASVSSASPAGADAVPAATPLPHSLARAGRLVASGSPTHGIPDSLYHSDRTVDMNFNTTGSAALAVDDLLSASDALFVPNTYITLLGRAPDAEGLNYYLSRLKSGISRLEVIAQIRLSAEGCSKNVELAGMNEAIKHYKKLKHPVFGPVVRSLSSRSPQEIHGRLRAVEHLIGQVQAEMHDGFSNLRESFAVQLRRSNLDLVRVIKERLDTLSLEAAPAATQAAAHGTRGFDSNWYAEQYPDVVAAGADLHAHYENFGKFEGRHPCFDAEWYAQESSDVSGAKLEPYSHYVNHGKKEGRHPGFDSHWYLLAYPDVALGDIEPRTHYLQHGRSEGRHPAFNSPWYLNTYPDIAAANIDPYAHYLAHGKAEGRLPGFSLRPGFAEAGPASIDMTDAGQYFISRAAPQYAYVPPQRPVDFDKTIAGLQRKTKFSIVVPIYNTPPDLLKAMLDSVVGQWYTDWELVLADDASPKTEIWENLQNIRDPRVVTTRLEKNQGIAGATNAAIAKATGDFVVFLDHDDELTPDCLYELSLCIERTGSDYIYSDEDKLTPEGRYDQPHHKPDWSPDTMMSTMYTSHVSAVRRTLLEKVGGLRSQYDGCQDWDLILRVTEQTTAISHIPKVLYHWRIIPGSIATDIAAKSYVLEATQRVRRDALTRRGTPGSVEAVTQVPGYFRVKYDLVGDPLISIIIPTRDNFAVLKRCIDSIGEKSSYRNHEIVILDNGSVKPDAVNYLRQLKAGGKAKVIRHDHPFNYSELNNLGVQHAKGQLLVFLNDDTEVITPDWMERMGGYAQLDHIGAVGAKLLYGDGATVQHAGVLNLEHGPGHAFLKSHKDSHGYYMRGLLEYNWSAVTGACLMVAREKFERIAGFEQTLPVAYNDIELCVKLHEAGLFNLVCQAVQLLHHESVSRGVDDVDPEKMKRLKRDLRHFYALHPKYFQYDPFHNPNLHPNGIHFELPL